ncbi:transposase [Escherichia coli]|nr:transposase [Escherichia coli]
MVCYVMLEPCYCVLRSSVADDFLNESKYSDTYLRTLLIHGAGTIALLTKPGSWITELKNVARSAWQPTRIFLYKTSALYLPY